MPAEPGFSALQDELAGWVRDPSRPVPAGLEPRRLAIYRELFFNNVREFIDAAFPVLKSLLPAPEWADLLQHFLAGHRAQSPYFRDISLEFRQWLERERTSWLAARPWAAELLHFEWAELAADCAALPPEPPWTKGDLMAGVPVLRNACWALAYRWPVHVLGPASPPAAEPSATPTFLLLWRDEADAVRQMEVSPLAARLVELLQVEPGPGESLLAVLAAQSGLEGAAVAPFVRAGAAVLEEFQERGLILGIRCDNPGP